MPMAAADVPKMVVIISFRILEFLQMAFGLKIASQRFQRLVDQVLALLDFVFIIFTMSSLAEGMRQRICNIFTWFLPGSSSMDLPSTWTRAYMEGRRSKFWTTALPPLEPRCC
jgi:hypothetical protein